MVDYNEQIRQLEDEISKTKYNKATQHHIGLVKAKIAKLREKQEKRSSKAAGTGFAVKKSGDATVILTGFPSVGKSTLLNALTNANSKTAAYAFTTLTVVPGLMEYNHAKIQILDVPGIVEGAARGAGRGKEVLSMVQNSDLILIVLDPTSTKQLAALQKELYDAKVRTNQRKPDVRITNTGIGGIQIASTVKLSLDRRTIIDVLRELGINNAMVLIREDITIEQLIDAIEGNKKYISAAVIMNKADMLTKRQEEDIRKELKVDMMVSATAGTNIERLKELIYKKLNFINIYCKEAGKKADMDVPLIMREKATVKDVCDKLHRNFTNRFRFAKIWGKSAKFPGQTKGVEHSLVDGDIVEVHLR